MLLVQVPQLRGITRVMGPTLAACTGITRAFGRGRSADEVNLQVHS